MRSVLVLGDVERRGRPRPSGVVHEDVDTTERGRGRGNHGLDLIDMRDVGLDNDRSSTESLDFPFHGRDRLVPPLGMLCQDDLCAGVSEADGNRPADPLGGSGNDGDLVLQSKG